MRAALKAMPDFARALARLAAAAEARATLRCFATGLGAAVALRRELEGKPDRPLCLRPAAASAGMTLVDG